MANSLLKSVQVGKVQAYPPVGDDSAEWRSAIVKTGVDGPVWLGKEGLTGDEQNDRKNHGGVYQAVNVYPSEHYDFWRTVPGLEAMTGGSFGENFTTVGLTEDTVCVGDVYQVGSAVVAITQPRQPCYKLSRRWKMEDLADRAEALVRMGWYFSVRQEGQVCAGDAIELLERPHDGMTIARVYALMHDPKDQDAVRFLAECELLSPTWRGIFARHARVG